MKNTSRSKQLSLKKPRSKKVWLIIIILICVAILTIAWYVNTNNNTDKSATDKNKGSLDSDTSSSSSKNNDETPQTGLPQNSDTTTSNQVPESTAVKVDITDFIQKDGSVQANAIIDSSKGNGSCVFTFTSEGAKPVVRQKVSTGSDGPRSCNVSVPEVEFTKLGAWNLNVSFYINDTRSEANRNVTIQ